MKKYEILLSKDGNCPYCGSDFVIKSGVVSSKQNVEVPEGMVIWKCYRCNKDFFCKND